MWIFFTVTKPKTTIIEQDPLDSELRILDWIIPFSSSFLIFSRFDGRTHEGLRWVESYGYHVNTNKKCVAVIEFKQGWVIRHFEADKLHSELRNLVWYSIKFVVTK
jgi:hypothetical protein